MNAPFFVQYQVSAHYLIAKMTETETRTTNPRKQQNGKVVAETSAMEDVFDDSYKEKDGPKPPTRLVWRNIISMLLLHTGAVYGVTLIPSASSLTLVWSKYIP